MDLDRLYEELPLKERKGQGNMVFKYIANEDVIDRMNKVFNGNWSTAVKHKEIVEDQVLVEVLVTAENIDTHMLYSHTGFGSQQIMRYKDGTNSGKIIDISNGFKSALSKAIVSACTRWGVGLYKETWGAGPVGVSNTPNTPAPMPNVPVNTNPAPVSPTPPMPSSPAPVNTPPTPPPTFTVPTAPNMPVSNSVSVAQTPVENNPVIPPPAPNPPVVNTVPSTPEVPFTNQNEDLTGFSDVQRVALNGILNMRGIKYEDLAKEAFEAKGINKPIPPKESLNYEDAVVIIKYGNDKYRKTS